MKTIEGKTAVVVAGGNGIGRAMALALADAGANLVIADIRGDDAEAVCEEVKRKGRRALSLRIDASKLSDMEMLANAAFEEFGEVHILCNNAGVAVRPFRAIWDTTYADLQYMVNINIWSLLNGYHVFVPRMRKQSGEKHIVNTSSMAAVLTYPGSAVYALTKEGLAGFSRVTAEELEYDGFGTTTLFPGLVNTPAAQRSGELRSEEERAADANVRSYASYAEERGEKVTALEAGRGAMKTPLGGEESQKAIEPEVVGQMVLQAILNNRPICFTHPVGPEGLEARFDNFRNAYHPLASS
ncbi:MAG: SDR family oxidoreductase [Sphingomonadaceae bacterium]